MEIKFLGTGGAFEPHKGNSSAIIEHGGKKILIDCGYTVLPTLIEQDLVKEIDYVLITHLHGDHIGSLPTFLAYAAVKHDKKIEIIYPTESFKNDLHELITMTFEAKRAFYIPLSEFPGIEHLDTFGQHVSEKQTFAYYFIENNTSIYYSGNLGNVETTVNFLKKCEESTITVFHDINWKNGPVHVYYKDAIEKLSGYTAYGYHCDKAAMPEDNTFPLVEDYPELNY